MFTSAAKTMAEIDTVRRVRGSVRRGKVRERRAADNFRRRDGACMLNLRHLSPWRYKTGIRLNAETDWGLTNLTDFANFFRRVEFENFCPS